jgi:anti-sigma factor RsiW
MNITRDVARDLLPLVSAGEASADSRALVEEFLRNDPELARLAEALREQKFTAPVPPPPPGRERAALERTRTLLRRRSLLLGLALFFTGLPLSFVADSGGLRFLLLRDAPELAGLFLAAAAGLWTAFGVTVRRLKVTGL